MKNLSLKDKFRLKSFIPLMDVLYMNLNKIATLYNYAAEKLSFLVDLHSSDEQQCDVI